MKRAIQKLIEDPLAEEILMSNLTEGDSIEIELNTEKQEVKIKGVKAKTKKNKKEEPKDE